MTVILKGNDTDCSQNVVFAIVAIRTSVSVFWYVIYEVGGENPVVIYKNEIGSKSTVIPDYACYIGVFGKNQNFPAVL